jgi:hypothetical protein
MLAADSEEEEEAGVWGDEALSVTAAPSSEAPEGGLVLMLF